MPKIKSPISPEEIRYNLRYTLPEQQRMLTEIYQAKQKGNYGYSAWERDFYIGIGGNSPGVGPLIPKELTEGQADKLAELYERYT